PSSRVAAARIAVSYGSTLVSSLTSSSAKVGRGAMTVISLGGEAVRAVPPAEIGDDSITSASSAISDSDSSSDEGTASNDFTEFSCGLSLASSKISSSESSMDSSSSSSSGRVLELANPGGFVIIPVAPSKYEDSPFCGYEVKLCWADATPKTG